MAPHLKNNQLEVLNVSEVTQLNREELKTQRLHLTYSDWSIHLKRKEGSDWLLLLG